MIPKFRAWGRDSNYPGTESDKFEMFYDVSVVTTFNDKEQHVIVNFGMYNEAEYNGTEIIDYTLMQSTGLFDKNGKEIFEGDVVNSCGYDSDQGRIYKTTDFTGVIVYRKNSFCLQFGDFLDSWWASDEEIEVIGNIYQNSDLLESVGE